MNEDLIYKYVPFSVNSLKLLIKGELWFGFPKNLNDPYEGEFLVKKYNNIPRKSLVEFFYEQHPDLCKNETKEAKVEKAIYDYSAFHKDVHAALKVRLKENYGVSSFSYDQKNILMWSHYSDSHKGFCIIFNKSKLLESLKYPWTEFYDVDYKPDLCVAELILEKEKIAFNNEKEILYRKLDIWLKENEARMIAIFTPNNLKRNIKFNKNCVKGIIIGENMLVDNRDTLQALIQNDPKYKEVKFYTAIKNLTKKEMEII